VSAEAAFRVACVDVQKQVKGVEWGAFWGDAAMIDEAKRAGQEAFAERRPTGTVASRVEQQLLGAYYRAHTAVLRILKTAAKGLVQPAAPVAPVGVATCAVLSDYEKARLQNIERNELVLSSLGISGGLKSARLTAGQPAGQPVSEPISEAPLASQADRGEQPISEASGSGLTGQPAGQPVSEPISEAPLASQADRGGQPISEASGSGLVGVGYFRLLHTGEQVRSKLQELSEWLRFEYDSSPMRSDGLERMWRQSKNLSKGESVQLGTHGDWYQAEDMVLSVFEDESGKPCGVMWCAYVRAEGKQRLEVKAVAVANKWRRGELSTSGQYIGVDIFYEMFSMIVEHVMNRYSCAKFVLANVDCLTTALGERWKDVFERVKAARGPSKSESKRWGDDKWKASVKEGQVQMGLLVEPLSLEIKQPDVGKRYRILMIDEPWGRMILNREKVLEIRGTKTNFVGDRIGLAFNGGTKAIYGWVDIVSSEGPLTKARYDELRNLHRIPSEQDGRYTEPHAWGMDNQAWQDTPISFPRDGGQLWDSVFLPTWIPNATKNVCVTDQ
jgi:hypothetical protein